MFLFRLSLAYMEAGSEPYDGFLAVKRRQDKYLEAWLRQYILIVLQAEIVCLGGAPRSRSAARPVSACMRNLEGDYLDGILCAIGNEIPDEVDGRSGMSALVHKMLPESILDNFGRLFPHLYISNSFSVSCTFLIRKSAAIIRFHSFSSTQRTNCSCCIFTIRRKISRNGRFVGPSYNIKPRHQDRPGYPVPKLHDDPTHAFSFLQTCH